MVKNTTGGGNAKKQARKLSTKQGSNELRKAESAEELYACITKNYGNRFDVITQKDGQTLSCRLAGKFKGRNKRNNIISLGRWVLVGLYEWEKEVKSCELLYIYEKTEIDDLRNLPGLDWKHLNIASTGNQDNDEESCSNIIFTEAVDTSKTTDVLFDLDDTNKQSNIQDDEEINIDDL